MSRRYSRIDEPEATTEVHEWWWTQPMPEPWQAYLWSEWQEAWVETTMRICRIVWSKLGATMYESHRDALLRDDLQSWLVVEAQTIANQYTPDPSYQPTPEDGWAAYLNTTLRSHARWHFASVVGHESKRSANRDEHRRGILSIEALDAQQDETGYVVARHPLHGEDLMSRDPESVLIRIENFAHEVNLIETERRSSGVYTVPSHGTCIELGCTNKAEVRGLCRSHRDKERLAWAAQRGFTCNIPDCGGAHRARGMCNKHLHRLRNGTLDPELMQYVEEARQRGKRPQSGAVQCSIEGCANVGRGPGRTRGDLCKKHYALDVAERKAAS